MKACTIVTFPNSCCNCFHKLGQPLNEQACQNDYTNVFRQVCLMVYMWTITDHITMHSTPNRHRPNCPDTQTNVKSLTGACKPATRA